MTLLPLSLTCDKGSSPSSLLLLLFLLSSALLAGGYMMHMPENSTLLWQMEQKDYERLSRLEAHIETLANKIGERNFSIPNGLEKTRFFLTETLESYGYTPTEYTFGADNEFTNIEVTVPGNTLPEEILVVGAHYDTAIGSPGANDNGTGVALLLELAQDLQHRSLKRTIKLVFFANEEPPFFQTDQMGSFVYAKQARKQNKNIIFMMSLETLGYYSDSPNSQRYPFPLGLFYPSRGNFIAVVGNLSSATKVRLVTRHFREMNQAPVEGGAFPAFLPGISWSDHWAFWQAGYKGIMLTDTALFRYPYYHSSEDLPEMIDFKRLTVISSMLARLIEQLGN